MSGDESSPLDDWRQGDLILAPFRLPVVARGSDGQLAIRNQPADHGIAVISQSCDIVRSTEKCPWVQVAILAQVDEKSIEAINRRKDPRMVRVPGLANTDLAIDLNFCCSIEKDVLAAYKRTCGCPCDTSQARLGEELARHRGRFGFPNLFNKEVSGPVRDWFKGKVGKNSPAGEFADAVIEVRVLCDRFEDPKTITLWLFLDEIPTSLPKEWKEAIEALERKASKSEEFPDVGVMLMTFDDISATEYRGSYLLSWEDVS